MLKLGLGDSGKWALNIHDSELAALRQISNGMLGKNAIRYGTDRWDKGTRGLVPVGRCRTALLHLKVDHLAVAVNADILLVPVPGHLRRLRPRRHRDGRERGLDLLSGVEKATFVSRA